MNWELALLLIFGGMIFMMVTGIPIAFAFLTVVLVGLTSYSEVWSAWNRLS